MIYWMCGPSKKLRRLTKAGDSQLLMALSFQGATTEYGEDQTQQS